MVQICSESYECQVSAKRMWHGLFKDAHNCLPKAWPLKVLAVEYPHGQHGFDFAGAERLIKFHQVLANEVHKGEESLHKEEACAKEEVAKVGGGVYKEEACAKEEVAKLGGDVHKEEIFLKEKVGGDVHKEELLLKEKVGEVGGATHKEAGILKEKVEEVGGIAHKGGKFIKEGVGKTAYEAAKLTEKVFHKEKEEAHKAIDIGEKLLHKEEVEVAGAFHKVGDFVEHEKLWIKEKIEEVDHEIFKIKIFVLAGGLIGTLFKHCKHTFEIKDTSHEGGHGCILHWTSEFETLAKIIHPLEPFEELKKHTLGTFHNVETYLLKHDDYAI